MEDIPIAQPLLSPLLDAPETSIEICKSCLNFFTRNENDKFSSAYYRCQQCQSTQIQKVIVHSCVIS